MFIAGGFKLFEITFNHLHAMTGGARRDQQRYDQDQRVEVVTQYAEEAETPDGLCDGADERQQHAIEPAEINDQSAKDEDERDCENLRQLAGVEPHPAFQHRLARGVEHGVAVLDVLADIHDLFLDIAVVQALFVETRQDQRRLTVSR